MFWARLHGGITHFPIAMIFTITFFEVTGLIIPSRRPELCRASYWLLLCTVPSVCAAAFSGLLLDNGIILGQGLLRQHHLLVWPSFALIIGLATWRLLLDGLIVEGPALVSYISLLVLACLLIGLAGYTGGEILLQRFAR